MTKIRHGGFSYARIDARRLTESYFGASCSGTNMTANRTLTLANMRLISNERIYLNGLRLTPTNQYTLVNNATGSVITFLPIVRNDSRIMVDYFT